VVVGAQPQAGHDVDLGIARGQDEDGQAGGPAAQPAAELEPALGLVAEADVDDREVGQAAIEPLLGRGPVGVGRDLVAVACQGVAQVFADRLLVFDDGDTSGHDASEVTAWTARLGGWTACGEFVPRRCHIRSLPCPCPPRPGLDVIVECSLGKCTRTRGIGMAQRETRESTGSMAGEMLGTGEAEGRIGHPGAWLEWLMLVGYAAATAIAIGCALAILVALTASAAMAAPTTIDSEATRSALQAAEGRIVPTALAGLPRVAGIEQAEGSGLLLATGEGLVVAPVQATSTRMKVTGSTVRSVVTQRFTNPSEASLEGVFVFPLPDDGA